jgi:hypothetical protein
MHTYKTKEHRYMTRSTYRAVLQFVQRHNCVIILTVANFNFRWIQLCDKYRIMNLIMSNSLFIFLHQRPKDY